MAKKSNNEGGLALLLGAAVGAAAGFWLNSTEGRLWRKKTFEQAEEFGKDFSTRASSVASNVQNDFSHFTDTAKKKVDQLNKQAQKTVEELKHMGDEFVEKTKTRVEKASAENKKSEDKMKSAFQEGVDKAKAQIDKMKNDLDHAL